ncbi:MAG: urate hydroxylase PuuD [bacterium]
MSDHLLQWFETLIRWFHITAGAAWIGTSFYFNWLNNNLRPPEGDAEPEVGSELWAVHGGGFYRVLKYKVAPARLPGTLHWFKWEAYFTWISGVVLLSLVYFLGASVYLLDPAKAALSPAAGVGVGVGVLVVGWLVYDLLCKSPLGRQKVALAALGFALFTGLAFGLCQVFSSRGAYILVGALIGTIMAGNVFFGIIPAQREMVDAMTAGRDPDPAKGKSAALRSLHNNYFTLPVLFIMISNHYPHTYGHAWDWAILAALALISASVRHWFNLRGRGEKNVWILPVATVAMVALALVSAPKSAATAAASEPVTFARVQNIVQTRCAPCHADHPTFEGTTSAPKDVRLDTAERIQAAAAQIKAKAVTTQYMPLANLTKMTAEERAVLGRWVDDGAKLE